MMLKLLHWRKTTMNLDLREIPAVYINLEQDVERKNSIVDVLDECGFENIIRVDGEYTQTDH